MALTGEDFFTSCKEAFFTCARNPVQYALVEGLGGVFITLGKLTIGSLSAYAGYKIITS